MKKTVLIALFLISSITMFGTIGDPVQEIEIGQQYIIQSVENDNYRYINFPNSNLIIKRGGIADFKTIQNLTVKIKKIKSSMNQKKIVVLERVDGKKFFNKFPVVTVDLENALHTGELKVK